MFILVFLMEPVVGANGSNKRFKETDERFKKGEWSDAAIHALLDAYEIKWNMRNRGNLRVGDWEEVASHVSCGGERVRSTKTPTQCKNKVEGMKKKYRSEASESCNNRMVSSAWPFFPRMDLLLRLPTRMAGIPGGLDAGSQAVVAELGFQDGVPEMESRDSDQPGLKQEGMLSLEANLRREIPFSQLQLLQVNHELQAQSFFPDVEAGQDVESNQEVALNAMHSKKETRAPGSDTSTPRSKATQCRSGNQKPNAKQQKQTNNEVAASIRTFADSILKLEQAKMEMYKDTERLRAEAEAKRADLELRRTEVIMNTQLQIAKLLSGKSKKRKKV